MSGKLRCILFPYKYALITTIPINESFEKGYGYNKKTYNNIMFLMYQIKEYPKPPICNDNHNMQLIWSRFGKDDAKFGYWVWYPAAEILDTVSYDELYIAHKNIIEWYSHLKMTG